MFCLSAIDDMFTELRQADSMHVPSTIVGIDPGSETLGVCILSFDAAFTLIKVEAATYRGSKLPVRDDIRLTHGDRAARIQAHYDNLLGILLQYQPIVVTCESPFFMAARPQAYGALTEVVTMIRNALQTYRPNLDLGLIDPPSVKKAVGAKGNADKVGVREAILRMVGQIPFVGPITLDRLDEHSLDAFAVAYSAYLTLRGELP